MAVLFLAHTIGIIGLVLFALSFQYSSPRQLLFLRVLGGLAMACHFVLLEAYTAALINLIAVVKTYVYYRYTRRDSWLIPVIFTVVLVGSTIFTWQGLISLLPFVAGLTGTYALWLTSAQRIRTFMLPASLFWLVHNIIIISPAAAVSDLINISSISVGLWRYRQRKSTVQKSP